MKIAVIGAGVVGIATAYELALDGHEVSVFEKNSAIAEESSFAISGVIATSFFHPLSTSAWPTEGWSVLGDGPSAISLTRYAHMRDIRWLWGWKRRPNAAIFKLRVEALHGFLHYSQARLHQLVQQNGLAYEATNGQLALVQSEAALAKLQRKLATLTALSVPFKVLTPDEARAKEPGIDAQFPVHAAVHFPQDETVNARQFAHTLKEQALALGVQFNFDCHVSHIGTGPSPCLAVQGRQGEVSFDQVVICTGVATAASAATAATAVAGLNENRIPLTMVHGYSISLPVRESLNAPVAAVFDCKTATQLVRLGNRIRVSGNYELGNRPASATALATRPLFHLLQTLFPGGAKFQQGTQIWKGTSTFTPDGLPLIGASTKTGVWLNIGHGHNGWAMASGSARLICDLISQKPPEIDSKTLSPNRFGH